MLEYVEICIPQHITLGIKPRIYNYVLGKTLQILQKNVRVDYMLAINISLLITLSCISYDFCFIYINSHSFLH